MVKEDLVQLSSSISKIIINNKNSSINNLSANKNSILTTILDHAQKKMKTSRWWPSCRGSRSGWDLVASPCCSSWWCTKGFGCRNWGVRSAVNVELAKTCYVASLWMKNDFCFCFHSKKVRASEVGWFIETASSENDCKSMSESAGEEGDLWDGWSMTSVSLNK